MMCDIHTDGKKKKGKKWGKIPPPPPPKRELIQGESVNYHTEVGDVMEEMRKPK